MKIVILSTSTYRQDMFDTYLTVTIKDKESFLENKELDIYCKKVTFENGRMQIVDIIGVSRYGETISEEKDYKILIIRPFSKKMMSFFSVKHFFKDDKGYHNIEEKPLLLTFQSLKSESNYVEMISNGITVDYFDKWIYSINFSHRYSDPKYRDWRNFDEFVWHLVAVECLAHPYPASLETPTESEKSDIRYAKEFDLYINLWDRFVQIIYHGDRALSSIQSDHDGGFEQSRQMYDAIYIHRCITKRDLIQWVSCLNDDIFTSYPNNPNPQKLNVSWSSPIIKEKLILPDIFKKCNFVFNEDSFRILDGLKYMDSNPCRREL